MGIVWGKPLRGPCACACASDMQMQMHMHMHMHMHMLHMHMCMLNVTSEAYGYTYCSLRTAYYSLRALTSAFLSASPEAARLPG